jgi:DNA polymerase III subunit alpha
LPLHLRVPAAALSELKIHQLRRILRDHPGESMVFLHIGQGKILRLADEFCVDLDRVVPELRVALGHDAVML